MAQSIDLKLVGDEAWPELRTQPTKELQSEHLQVAFLSDGTSGGKPVVLIRSDTDGTAYVVQITGRQFQAIAAALLGKYGIID